MRDVPPDVQTNASAGTPDSRLFVLVIDDAMIPQEPWIIQQSKKAARSVIEKLSPADRMAVVLTAESKHAQDFTSDRSRLLAAVETMKPEDTRSTFSGGTTTRCASLEPNHARKRCSCQRHDRVAASRSD